MKKVFAVMLAAALLTGCSAKESSAEVLKINDKAVLEAEYMLYLDEAADNFETIGGKDIWDTDFDGVSAEDTAKEMALNSLLTIKISALKADEYGFELTAEELESVKNDVAEYLAGHGSGQTDIKLVETIMTDKAKYNKIRESTYANYTPSDAELSEYFTEYYDVYEDMYTEYALDTVMVESTEKGEELISRFKAGEDFDSLTKEYETDESVKDEGFGVRLYKAELENTFATSVELEVGDITPVLSSGDEHYVMLLTEKNVPDEEQVKGYIRDEYAYYEKQNIFDSEYQKWYNSTTVEINDEVYSKISVER